MNPSRVITSPVGFVIEDYAPGLTIDFRHPPETSDLDQARADVDLSSWATLKPAELLQSADALCCQLGVSERSGDLIESLQRFANTNDPAQSLHQSAALLSLDATTPHSALVALLNEAGVLQSARRDYPVRLYCHNPEMVTNLDQNATHFGYVLGGQHLRLQLANTHTYPLYPGSFFCVPGEAQFEGQGQIVVLSSFGAQGTFSIGGPIEGWGRLNYIDGCTDTLMVPPVKKGDPCFNALYFPKHTKQTLHTHPSLRAGTVVNGAGICKTPTGDHALSPGKIFFLPPETWHAFHTESCAPNTQSALTVVAFHPDSDFGPTDEDHPMLNRTYYQILHRLRSLQRTAG